MEVIAIFQRSKSNGLLKWLMLESRSFCEDTHFMSSYIKCKQNCSKRIKIFCNFYTMKICLKLFLFFNIPNYFSCSKEEVSNNTDEFIKAADMSMLPLIESEGTIYYNSNNIAEDAANPQEFRMYAIEFDFGIHHQLINLVLMK